MRYICTLPCFHNGHRFRRGDVFSGSEDMLPHTEGELRHFEVLGREPETPVQYGPEVVINGKKPDPEEIVAEPEEIVCEKCGVYKGNARQVNMHKITCKGKKTE
jgi:hypothetical protein